MPLEFLWLLLFLILVLFAVLFGIIEEVSLSLSLSQSSPPSLCAEGRTPDLQSILSVIADAQQFVYIAVMNYLPTMEYSSHKRSIPCLLLHAFITNQPKATCLHYEICLS